MKTIGFLFLIFVCFAVNSCAVGKGCPVSGRSIGAERILSGDPKALKAVKKAEKFRH